MYVPSTCVLCVRCDDVAAGWAEDKERKPRQTRRLWRGLAVGLDFAGK